MTKSIEEKTKMAEKKFEEYPKIVYLSEDKSRYAIVNSKEEEDKALKFKVSDKKDSKDKK